MDFPLCDVLITGGRVIDPENAIDVEVNIGIVGDKIAYVGEGTPEAQSVIDVRGKIVAPGFIDLHSHAQDLAGHRLQALDGVTTSLELEGGAAPVSKSYDWSNSEGRPLHYGYSAGWLYSRAIIKEQFDENAVAGLSALPLDAFSAIQGGAHWREPATAEELQQILGLVEEQLDAGAIGIGVLLGYAPRTSSEELHALGKLAMKRQVPLFVHMRWGARVPDHTPVEGVSELLELSRTTGAQVHLCHFASSNASMVEESAQLISEAQAEGLPFTTESYPFGLASTVIGAEFLSPESLQATNTPASTITYLKTGEEVASFERLRRLRAEDPGGLCLIRYYDEREPAQLEQLKQAVSLQGAAFASDAMVVQPLDQAADRSGLDLSQWPLPSEGITVHPRTTSCYVRALSWLHRDTGTLGLSEVIDRSSALPARILRSSVPAMERKGHLGVGADADVVIFDLQRLEPNTSFAPVTPSKGIEHVLVGGTAVVSGGELLPEQRPGQPVFVSTST
ncbi:amidohydrolase family protein [Nesterenkonia populi]|uniref:amidohydrolase family protein n=1 Tax=Nesterenkonia populi TaxID=1591087 RepID=UPI0011BE5EA6|nr:amidohydrolase family protein [Nesterenkonia populi]